MFKKLFFLCFLFQSCKHEITKKPVQYETLVAFEDTTKLFGWGYKNLKGQIVIEPQYAVAEPDTCVDAIVFVFEKKYEMTDEKHGWIAINRQNQFVLKPFIYDNGPDYIEEGLFRFIENGSVGQGGKMGFADRTGQKVIPAKYTFVSPFFDGMAAFCYNCQKKDVGEHWFMVGKFGYIDKKGNEIIAPLFDEVEGFKNGQATVKKNGQSTIINKKGEQIEVVK